MFHDACFTGRLNTDFTGSCSIDECYLGTGVPFCGDRIDRGESRVREIGSSVPDRVKPMT